MTLFDKYVFKILAGATFVTALSLTLIILLTQSIRYLELVISSDASPAYFLIMIGFAIPKFLEAILPLAFAIGAVYTANRILADREAIIMSSAGSSVVNFGRGFLVFAGVMMILQFALSGWISPLSVSQLQQTRSDVKNHYATLIFREGVFSTLNNGLTVFVEKRSRSNELHNLMIHDERGNLNKGKETTVLAERGIVNLFNNNQQLLIYNGTQYQKDLKTGVISKLDFDQYTLEIPAQQGSITRRWKEPDERTLDKLFIPKDTTNSTDLRNRDEFIAELHKRFSTPLLYAAFILSILTFMFLGSWNRRQQTAPLVQCGLMVIVVQALYIVCYNEAQDKTILNAGLYIIPLAPILYAAFRMKNHLVAR